MFNVFYNKLVVLYSRTKLTKYKGVKNLSKKDNKKHRISCRLTDYEYELFVKLMQQENKNITQLMSNLIINEFKRSEK